MCLIAPITGLLCFVVSCQPNKKNTFSKDVRNEIPVNSQGIPLYLVSYYDICLLILMCYCLTINASLMFLLEFSVLFLCQSWVVLDESGWVLTRGLGARTKAAGVANVTFVTHTVQTLSFRCSSIMELFSHVGANTLNCWLVFASIFLRKRWKERSCLYPMGAILTPCVPAHRTSIDQQMSQLRSWGSCVNRDVGRGSVPGMCSGRAAWSRGGSCDTAGEAVGAGAATFLTDFRLFI